MVLLILLLLIAVVCGYLCYKTSNELWVIPAFIFGLSFLIMIGFAIGYNITADGKYQQYKQRYDALLFKAQEESLRDEFGLLNKEFVDEVQFWNEDIAKYKAYSNNGWIGIFYPRRCIECMDVIDLSQFSKKER